MSRDARLRLMLVDDHDVARAGARHYLEEHFEIVGEADDVEGAIELIGERQPDVVLLDVRLPGGGGAAVIDAIRPADHDVKFLAFTVSTSRDDVARLFHAGVDGYLTKATLGVELADAVEQVAAGGRPISPEVAGYLLDIDESIDGGSGIERLTPRERQVVNLIARGHTYRETASRLDMSVKTLETHMSHIFAKLGVASRHELTAIAYDTGFVRPDDD
jgi:DNA-binding NarL/FixJ family response regulator